MRKATAIIKMIDELEQELKKNYSDKEINDAILDEQVRRDNFFFKDDNLLIYTLNKQCIKNILKEE